MRERIEEQVAGVFSKEILKHEERRWNNIIADMSKVTEELKARVYGSSDHNFVIQLDTLKIRYHLPTLAPKPFLEYSLEDTTEEKYAREIEFAKNYNEKTRNQPDGLLYAVGIDVGLQLEDSSVMELGNVLLYNSGVRLQLPLMPHLTSYTMNPKSKLVVKLSKKLEIEDEMVIAGSYTGVMNYTFDKSPTDAGMVLNHIFS